jgi:hypothetical protein
MSENTCPCDRCGCDDTQTQLYNLNDNGTTYTATFCVECENLYAHLIVDDEDDESVVEDEEDPNQS